MPRKTCPAPLTKTKKPKADNTMKNKYNLIARVAVVALVLTAVFAFTTSASALSSSAYGPGRSSAGGNALPDSTLWYNGDLNSVNGLANERNTLVTQAAVYDDFIATANWTINAVFSDNLANTTFTGADWEIRTGVAEGNPGTLIASGTTNSPLVTLTGRSAFNYLEYQVEVTGLNVNLIAGTRYFLNVTPIGNGAGRSFDSNTSGANCIGTPCGNNQNAFFNSTYFGANFTSTANEGQPTDFSMGVIGTVPEPTTVALLACGVGALLIAVRRRRSS
jgi:hypothetical protein